MKIWDLNKSEEIEQPKEMKEFIEEIIKVMKKYNLSISHEDGQGAFIIEKYDEYNIKWLKNAMKNYCKMKIPDPFIYTIDGKEVEKDKFINYVIFKVKEGEENV